MTLSRPLALGLAALLYGAAALGANVAAAAGLTPEARAEIEAMRAGDMRKLVLHAAPRPPLASAFEDGDGVRRTVADFAGRMVVLNLWATWCPPCRAEMPSLDRLAGRLEGTQSVVVALSTDRGGKARVVEFYRDIGVRHLAVYVDPANRVPREAGVLGLPVTLILDAEGREVGRVTGEAEWDAPEALAILARLESHIAPRGGIFLRPPGAKTPGVTSTSAGGVTPPAAGTGG